MPHIEPTREALAALAATGRHADREGPVVMLNLLRFRDTADYSRSPELAPDQPISGAEAYRRYSANTAPLLAGVGGEVRYDGAGGDVLIGPADERWDRVLLVRYPDLAAFTAMTTDPAYLAGVGHRTAALADSRLLPTDPAS